MIPFDEHFLRHQVSPAQMDALWAQGWRHFGPHFFRYALTVHRGYLQTILPLRIDLTKFSPTRSQRRVLKRNSDLRVEIRETRIDELKHEMFFRHRERFDDNVPDSLHTFLSDKPASVPCPNVEICAYAGDQLLAVSFLDLGKTSTSAVYAMFEPTETRRSLGIFTMLVAIQHSTKLGCRYYYPGYCSREPSVYDYKKRFPALEYFDWESGWHSYTADVNDPTEDEP